VSPKFYEYFLINLNDGKKLTDTSRMMLSSVEFELSLFVVVELGVWGYIVAFTKVLTMYQVYHT
jgi:hypothetical protein